MPDGEHALASHDQRPPDLQPLWHSLTLSCAGSMRSMRERDTLSSNLPETCMTAWVPNTRLPVQSIALPDQNAPI